MEERIARALETMDLNEGAQQPLPDLQGLRVAESVHNSPPPSSASPSSSSSSRAAVPRAVAVAATTPTHQPGSSWTSRPRKQESSPEASELCRSCQRLAKAPADSSSDSADQSTYSSLPFPPFASTFSAHALSLSSLLSSRAAVALTVPTFLPWSYLMSPPVREEQCLGEAPGLQGRCPRPAEAPEGFSWDSYYPVHPTPSLRSALRMQQRLLEIPRRRRRCPRPAGSSSSSDSTAASSSTAAAVPKKPEGATTSSTLRQPAAPLSRTMHELQCIIGSNSGLPPQEWLRTSEALADSSQSQVTEPVPHHPYRRPAFPSSHGLQDPRKAEKATTCPGHGAF